MTGNVLLVDDETYITKNLQQVIPWHAMGLNVIGTAKNGQEALRLLDQERVDLLLCDIRMPVMDGLELVREIRKNGYDCEMIMLSGYEDFEYTRAAIRYGVKDYILKPIPYEELTEVIRRTMEDRRIRQQEQRERQEQLGKMLDLASEKVLYDILMDYADVSPHSLVLAGKERNLRDKQYALMVLDVDRYSHISRHWTDKDRKLWNYAVHKVVGEALQVLQVIHAVVQMRDGEWCVLIQDAPEQMRSVNHETLQDWASHIQNAAVMIKKELNIGICSELLSMTELSQAYKTVQQGMQLSPERQRIAFYSMHQQYAEEGTNHLLWNAARDLVSALRTGNPIEVENILLRLSERLQSIRDASSQRVQNVLNFFALHLLREMKEIGLAAPEQEDRLWTKIEFGLSIQELIAIIREWMTESISDKEKKKNSELLMLEAKEYIDRNAYQDLGIDEVAGHLGISSSYFSLLFRQEFGETFIEYVTRQRMEKAKSLLAFTSKSVAQIAKELGYSDRRYFNKVFVKYTGEKPLDFRSKKRNN